MNTLARYTAAQIGRALNKTRQTIAQALSGIEPAGTVTVSGNQASAWEFIQLPFSIREELARRARRQGYRDAEHLLSAPTEAWQPVVPLAECVPADREKAEKLCRAFAETWKRAESPVLSDQELVRMGVEDFRREFGYGVDERTWRRIRERTIDRDRGLGDLNRPELYLDDNARRAAPEMEGEQSESAAWTIWEKALGEYIAANSVNGPLGAKEKRYVWFTALKTLATYESARTTQARLKSALCDFLVSRAPSMARSRDSLRKQIGYKFEAYLAEGVRGFDDKRTTKYRKKTVYTDEQLAPLLAITTFETEGACISEGYRRTDQRGALPEEIKNAIANPARKSHLKSTLRAQAGPIAKTLAQLHRGLTPGDMPYKERDWSLHTGAGTVFSADDVTLPNYVIMEDENGGHTLSRGQFILMIDERSMRILGFCFIKSRNYNSLAIRSLMTKVCSSYGLPNLFYFERAMWETARVIKGRPGSGPFGFEDIEVAFGDFAGVEFQHATSPCAKVIEIVNKRIQRLMPAHKGYCGPCEVKIRYLKNERRMMDVKSGRVFADEWFYHAKEWVAHLAKLIEDYNNEPGEGKILNGLSPNQAYEHLRDLSKPRDLLPPNLRYLLSHHKIPVAVSFKGGIQFKIGKESFRYLGEASSRYIGETVIAWFDPENPDQIIVTDRDQKNPEIVERMKGLPPHGATPEELAEENRKIAGHLSRPKALFHIVQNCYEEKFRSTELYQEQEHQRQFNAAQKAASEAASEARREAVVRRKTATIARRIGATTGANEMSHRADAEHLKHLDSFLNDGSESETQP